MPRVPTLLNHVGKESAGKMYNLFCELERQRQRIQPVIVRVTPPLPKRRLSAAWGGMRGADLARVTSVTPGSAMEEKYALAAMFLRIGFPFNMRIFKLRYNKHPVACTGL